MKSYHPAPRLTKLTQTSTSELHRLLTDYRYVYAVFSKISGRAKGHIKTLQSELTKRGASQGGKATEPDPNSLKRPITGNGVSEHAMLRYIERVKGMDIAALEAEILGRVEAGESYFNGAVITDAEDISYIMREDGLVKSIMPQSWLEETDMLAAEESMKMKPRKPKSETAYASSRP